MMNLTCIFVFKEVYYALLVILTLLATMNSEMLTSGSPEKQCTQYEFYDNYTNLCNQCSLCYTTDKIFQREECIKKNEGVLYNGLLYLYCDAPNGPFPDIYQTVSTTTLSINTTSTSDVIHDSSSTLPTNDVSLATDLNKDILIGLLVPFGITLVLMAAAVVLWRKRKRRLSTSGDGLTGETPEADVEGALLTVADDSGEKNRCCGNLQLREKGSCKAFKALINDRAVLAELVPVFDRDYAPDMITWHSLAMELLQLEPAKVVHKEYVTRPSRNENPSHSPTFGVLQEMYCRGLCLHDLLLWLRQPEQSRRFNAARAGDILRQVARGSQAKDLPPEADRRAA